MERLEIISKIGEYFDDITEINDVVVRAVRYYKETPYQVFYFDFSEEISYRRLQNYHKEYISDDYFQYRGSMQWNYYVVFLFRDLVDKNEKQKIESNLDFARKFVIQVSEFNSWIDRLYKIGNSSITENLRSLCEIWKNELDLHGLGFLHSDHITIEEGLDIIISGNYLSKSIPILSNDKIKREEIDLGQIEWLKMIDYREYPKSDKPFSFTAVNLISAPNAHGKTSLLEAIEYFYTGENHRKIGNESEHYIEGKVVGVPQSLGNANSQVLKERDKIWYNSQNQNFRQSISTNFNKFNFFNTDASFKLTLNQSESEVENGFRALALGDEVVVLSKRIYNHLTFLQNEEEARIKLINETRLDIERASNTLAELANTNQNIDELFLGLKRKVDASKISLNFFNYEYSSLIALKSILDSIVRLMQILILEVDWIPDLNFTLLSKEKTQLSKIRGTMNLLKSDYEVNIAVREKLEEKIRQDNSNLELLNLYQRYLDSDIEKRIPNDSDPKELELKKREELFRIKGKLEWHLRSSYGYKNVKVHEIKDDLIEDLLISTNHRIGLRSSREKAAKKLNNLKQILNRVVEDVDYYQRFTYDGCQCQFCKPENINSIKVQENIKKNFEASEENRTYIKLTAELNTAEERHWNIVNDLEQLGNLKTDLKFGGILNPNSFNKRGVNELINKLLSKINQQLENQSHEIKSRYEEQKNQRKSQFTYEGFLKIKGRVLANFGENATASLKFRKKLISEFENNVKNKRNELSRIIDKIKELEQAKKRTLGEYEFGEIKDNLNLENEFYRRAGIIENFKPPLIDDNVIFDKNTNIKSILPYVTLIADEVTSICFKLNLDNKSENLSKQTIDILSEKQSQLDKILLERERINVALKSINSMLERYSEEIYLNEFLKTNSNQIKEIFLNIHSPQEFINIILLEGKIKVVRQNGEICDLNSISTGQRSALAISIFFTLNNTLVTGPPVLLFDDPVAFVDDLNVLSYLDYLREVILKKKFGVQMFFTTSNENIAFLFEKKFEMFGNKFNRIALER